MGHKAKRTIEREEDVARRKAARQSNTPRQVRARARRASKVLKTELEKIYKPLEEWDDEELARGRPRAVDGSFKGKTPEWVSREVHEETIRRFQSIVKTGMNVHTISALRVIGTILEDNSVDDNDKPRVSASAKLDAAKFLVEHVVGKPTQRTETDISVRLQGILGVAMVPTGEGLSSGAMMGNILDLPGEEDDELDGEQ